MTLRINDNMRLEAHNLDDGPQIGVFVPVHPWILTRFGILVVGNLINPDVADSGNAGKFSARK